MSIAIFLNGPARVGKDTAQTILHRHLNAMGYAATPMWFAQDLKEFTHRLFKCGDLPFDAFDAIKDTPQPIFLGLTPRQAYIAVSERFLKPVYGKDILGRMSLSRIRQKELVSPKFPEAGYVFVGGFTEELDPIIHHIGATRCLLIRLHWKGEGKADICGMDPRTYVYRDDIACSDQINEAQQPALLSNSLIRLIDDYFGPPIVKLDQHAPQIPTPETSLHQQTFFQVPPGCEAIHVSFCTAPDQVDPVAVVDNFLDPGYYGEVQGTE